VHSIKTSVLRREKAAASRISPWLQLMQVRCGDSKAAKIGYSLDEHDRHPGIALAAADDKRLAR
jgi:hypothetical protein